MEPDQTGPGSTVHVYQVLCWKNKQKKQKTTTFFLFAETDPESSLVHNVIDRDVYLHELEKLRPHAQTLLAMLNEIRHKMRAMDNTDPRVPTYK